MITHPVKKVFNMFRKILKASLIGLFFGLKNKNYSLKRYGSKYGGWYISTDNDLVSKYLISAGVGEDISFEIDFSYDRNDKIYFVDPTPRAISYFNSIIGKKRSVKSKTYSETGYQLIESYEFSDAQVKNFYYIPKALSKVNSKLKFYKPSNSLYVSHSLIKNDDSISDDYIEVETLKLMDILDENKIPKGDFSLKLDIESSEIEVIQSFLKDGLRPKQLLVEFDKLKKFNASNFLKVLFIHIRLIRFGYLLIYRENLNFTYIRKKYPKI